MRRFLASSACLSVGFVLSGLPVSMAVLALLVVVTAALVEVML